MLENVYFLYKACIKFLIKVSCTAYVCMFFKYRDSKIYILIMCSNL